ncbi:D-alanyl-D-alanine carboxypeptidase family protein [Mycetocola reblochoni]|uniref:D-alanyl-D-alanine carboxypeptidase n=2 Tax=Mycetocola reblochoni TaxID=331618 RepID=A0A1R4J5S3_9MICO|nr:D-alanyl-D-alanine carboxypeptidase [Mycetocola reblochoni]RLP69582.1 D-alanyl-D-alanine carboxypeptidase [Mycetocola reblochoni]SJN27359.1 D-alanyl-D-alanine carboxypeptidase [Mycetocola reblochoni REB411]
MSATDRRATGTRRRRTISAVAGALATVLVLGGAGYYGYTALTAPLPAASASIALPSTTTSAASALPDTDWPDTGAGAISILSRSEPLSEFGDASPRPIASITKVITALVILDKHPLAADEDGPDIAITADDAALFWDVLAADGTSAPVYPGTSLTQRQVLEAIMLPSANNYAISLSRWAFGSDDAFLEAARSWLEEHGMDDTVVTDASGLDAGSVSTPRDLLTLAGLAMQNTALSAIASQTSAELPMIGTIENSNELLGVSGVTGIKTGTSNAAGAGLLFSAEVDVDGRDVTLVGAVLGQDTPSARSEAVRTAIESTTGSLHAETLIPAGTAVGEYRSAWGDRASLYITADLVEVLWRDEQPTITVDAEPVSTADSGDEVGTLVSTVPGHRTSVPVAVRGGLNEPSPWWRLANPNLG